MLAIARFCCLTSHLSSFLQIDNKVNAIEAESKMRKEAEEKLRMKEKENNKVQLFTVFIHRSILISSYLQIGFLILSVLFI